jgi:hypothetical protein
MASMYAMPRTLPALAFRRAQSKPSAEPQSWTARMTGSVRPSDSMNPSRYSRCSKNEYRSAPLGVSLSESPMPMRSGAMQR